jgi:hypothetical protein
MKCLNIVSSFAACWNRELALDANAQSPGTETCFLLFITCAHEAKVTEYKLFQRVSNCFMSAATRCGGAALWGVLRSVRRIHSKISLSNPAASMTSSSTTMIAARPLTANLFKAAPDCASTSYARACSYIDAPLHSSQFSSLHRHCAAPVQNPISGCLASGTGMHSALRQGTFWGNLFAKGNAGLSGLQRRHRCATISAVAQTQSLTKEGKES